MGWGLVITSRVGLAVETNRGFEPALEIRGRGPAQFIADTAGIDGIAQVMPLAVRHKGDLRFAGPCRSAVDLIVNAAEMPHQIQVIVFVVTADIVGLAVAPVVKDRIHGPNMIAHVEPIPHIGPCPVHGDGSAFGQGADHHGDELLGVLPRAVIVGAIGEDHGQTVGMVVSADKVIGGRLGGGIRGAGIVGGGFVKQTLCAQAAVHLVGGNMVEQTPAPVGMLTPGRQRRIEQGHRADNIGAHKFHGVGNGAVHMAFGSQVHHPIEGVLGKEPLHQFGIADIAHHQLPLAQASAGIQVGGIAGVGHLVEDHQAILGVMTDPMLDGMGSDESGTSGN